MPDALMSLLTGGVLGLGWWAMLAVLLVCLLYTSPSPRDS